MSILLFLINVLATLCFARNSLELSDEGRALVKRLDKSATGAINAVSKQSIGDVLGGLTFFVGVIALESFICVVLNLYIPTFSEAWRNFWRILFIFSSLAGIAITWITMPKLINHRFFSFSLCIPLIIFLFPLMDLLAGTSGAVRTLGPVAEMYKSLGFMLPVNAWVYAVATAVPILVFYLAAWLSMTVLAWVIITPVAAIAFCTIKLARWGNRWFPTNVLTPISFLAMIASAAYSWFW